MNKKIVQLFAAIATVGVIATGCARPKQAAPVLPAAPADAREAFAGEWSNPEGLVLSITKDEAGNYVVKQIKPDATEASAQISTCDEHGYEVNLTGLSHKISIETAEDGSKMIKMTNLVDDSEALFSKKN